MKILIDKNIPYVEHFFADHLDQIEYFSDEDFEIENVKEDSVVVVRSTYKTLERRFRKVLNCCVLPQLEDHIDLKQYDDENSLAFSTGANAIAVENMFFQH